jgi:CubicO group peptidase (beta-lactamase class C family)
MLTIQGFVARGCERVRDAFAANFEHQGDVGAPCAVYRAGQPVVDVWAGFADLLGGRPWEEDTVQLVFSATKGVTATCVNLLVERGAIDVDTPIAAYWPAFAARAKDRIPVRWAVYGSL